MSKPMVKIYDVKTDSTVEREMTDNEFEAYEAANKAKAEADAKAEAEKQAVISKLAALGLTIEDLRILGLG